MADIVIIGGDITLIEAGKRIGHSILASGNGRCNFSNANVAPGYYWNEDFVEHAFSVCDPDRVMRWFSDLGLHWTMESYRLYPMANKSSSVLDVLRFALEEAGVDVICDCRVLRIIADGAGLVDEVGFPVEGGFTVECEDRSFHCDAVIVACGGQVTRELLPDGYRFVAQTPRLCPLRTDPEQVKGLDNIRVKATASLISGGSFDAGGDWHVKKVERGEIQFRPFGLSGIAAFNLSRFAEVGDVVELDLLPELPIEHLVGDLASRQDRFCDRTAGQLLAGLVLPRVGQAALRAMGLSSDDPQEALEGRELELANVLKAYWVRIVGFEGQSAQVHRGGVDVRDVDPWSMESHLNEHLFITGEALDVDGPCGGFNLHWAWTTGILAGVKAARGY